MAISTQITPGQVSFLLGYIPISLVWVYSELLQYWKRKYSLKIEKHFDADLACLNLGQAREDAETHLLEGCPVEDASEASRFSPLVRFFCLDKDFLIDNRLILRSMTEFGALLLYYYICDRTDLFGESTKISISTIEYPVRGIDEREPREVYVKICCQCPPRPPLI